MAKERPSKNATIRTAWPRPTKRLRTSGSKLPVLSYRFYVTGSKLPVLSYRFYVTGSTLPAPGSRFKVPNETLPHRQAVDIDSLRARGRIAAFGTVIDRAIDDR